MKKVELIYKPRPNSGHFAPELRPGQTVSVSEAEAENLLDSGAFEPVLEKPKSKKESE